MCYADDIKNCYKKGYGMKKNTKKQITAATILLSFAAITIFVNMKLVDVASSGNVLEAEGLLKNSKNLDAVNQTDALGDSPLYIAVTNNKMAMIKFLIENNASANTPNKHGYYPLYAAALAGNNDAIKFLLNRSDAQKNINTKNGGEKEGGVYTALHAAIIRGHPATVKLLLARGANPAIKTADGKNAYQLAEELSKGAKNSSGHASHEKIVEILRAYQK